jgi:hypothetical protein
LYRLWTENKDLLTTLDQVAGIYPEFNRKLAQLRAAFIERYVEVLRNLQAEKKVYADLDPFHTAATLSAMLEQAMRLWVGKGDWHDPKVALETLNKMWARAVGARQILEEPGREKELAQVDGSREIVVSRRFLSAGTVALIMSGKRTNSIRT